MTGNGSTPWWLSHGPAAAGTNTAGPAADNLLPPLRLDVDTDFEAAATSESQPSDESGWQQWLDGFDPKAAQSALRAGLGLFTAFAQAVATPSHEPQVDSATHSLIDCGVCPLCVAVSALKEHEPTLGGLVESAMAGVTSSAERLAEFVPNTRDAVTDQLVSAVVRSVLARFQA